MSYAAAIREGFMNRSRSILPRVGGGVGVGGRGGNVVLHSSYLTTREPHPVDNPRRPAVPDAACNAFGEIDGWAR